MAFLINLLFAFLGYFVAVYLLDHLQNDHRISVVVGVIVAVVVFMANLAGLVL